MFTFRPQIWFAAALFVISCSRKVAEEEPEATPAPAQTSAPAADPKVIFSQRCVPCHGATGLGDGPASASLDPKPRKYVDKEWQASVTDDYLEKAIKFGGAGVGKSPAMPSNPDLSPEVIKGLKDIIRAFGNQ